jgi:hypothetical protein
MAGQRIGGTCFLNINGMQYPLRASGEYMPAASVRNGVAGQDGVHGYTEKPSVPGFKGDISDLGALSIQLLQQSEIAVATMSLANGKVVVGYDGWVEGDITASTEEGKFNCELRFKRVQELPAL